MTDATATLLISCPDRKGLVAETAEFVARHGGNLVRKGRDLERVVLARAVRLHLDNRIIVYGNRTSVLE